MKTDNIKKYIQENIKFDDDICYQISDYLDCTDEYIDEIFHEISDSNIDLYLCDLLDWIKKPFAIFYIEESVRTCGIDNKNFDFMRLIQAGQYEYYMDKINDNRHEMLLLWGLQYCVKNDIALTDKQIENLNDSIDDSFNRFNDLIDAINKIK